MTPEEKRLVYDSAAAQRSTLDPDGYMRRSTRTCMSRRLRIRGYRSKVRLLRMQHLTHD